MSEICDVTSQKKGREPVVYIITYSQTEEGTCSSKYYYSSVSLLFNRSTVSSSINALAAVTVEDLIKPHADLSEKQLNRISKGLSEWRRLFVWALCLKVVVKN